jgi:Domain of unknown function (DUF4153)
MAMLETQLDADGSRARMGSVAGERTDQTTLSLAVLLGGLLLGLAFDGLLRTLPWGVNVPLAALAVGVTVGALVRWRRLSMAEGRWLGVPLLVFAAGFAWRDSPTLRVSNGLAVLLTVGLGSIYLRYGQPRRAGLLDYALGCAYAGFHACLGALSLLFHDVRWGQVGRGAWGGPLLAVGRGLALALPLLLVFGGLFVAADAIFEGLVTRLFHVNLSELLGHLVVVTIVAWLAAGLLQLALVRGQWRPLVPGGPGPLALGAIELGIVLGLVDLLFLSFVIVQLGYLFGGTTTVLAENGPTYAEYARRGFFELVAVAALALGLLLVSHWLQRRVDAGAERQFRLLAGIMVGLLAVVILSAVQRMLLYVEIYGLTEFRIYTTAFMAWIALVLVWLVATVLRGRREHFAIGALGTGFVVLLLLNCLNPDALIVRINAGRVLAADPQSPSVHSRATPEPLDDRYLLALSADAVPGLVEALPSFGPEQRARVATVLLERWMPPHSVDWRGWNLSRWQAWQTVATSRSTLEALTH